MSECKIIKFPQDRELFEDEYEEPEKPPLTDDDVLNLFFGAVNLIKRHATTAQLELLVEKISEAREGLFGEYF